MGVLAAVVLALFLAAALAFAGCSREASRDSAPSTPRVETRVTNGLSRDEIRARLRKTARMVPTGPLSVGAMCYEPAMPPPTSSFVCPKCGSKTLYSEELAALVEWELPSCRASLSGLSNPYLRLDESEFCRQCKPDIRTPSLILLIQYNDQFEPRRVRGITPEDLVLLREFFEGKATHEGDMGLEEPLRDHLYRIEKLLGVSRDEPKP